MQSRYFAWKCKRVDINLALITGMFTAGEYTQHLNDESDVLPGSRCLEWYSLRRVKRMGDGECSALA